MIGLSYIEMRSGRISDRRLLLGRKVKRTEKIREGISGLARF